MLASTASADMIRDVAYASPGSPGNARLLDLYRPEPGTPAKAYTIVLVHGGSYSGGRKEDLADLAVELAMIGYTVITPNYTLATSTLASFPQPVIDIMNVVHWARTDGASLDVPNRIILGGHSAGSTIAMTAAMGGTHFTNQPAPADRGYIIDGAIGLAGRYDILWNASVGIPQTVVQYLGVSPYTSNWNLVYAFASATTHVDPCSPPTVLYHGTSDGLIPINNMSRLSAALTNSGVPVRVSAVQGVGHDMAVIGYTTLQQALTIDDAVQFIYQNGQTGCGRIAPPPPLGKCCEPTGACTLVLQAECAAAWDRLGTCEPNYCPMPGVPGACCQGAVCVVLTPEQCVGSMMSFAGSNSACNVAGDMRTPCCKADFNHTDGVTVQDIFDYLNAWFAGEPVTAIDLDVQGYPTVASIFVYLNAWFAGC